jgi:hypothetical protein
LVSPQRDAKVAKKVDLLLSGIERIFRTDEIGKKYIHRGTDGAEK